MWQIPFFRIFYSTSFTILLLITFALLAISPIDIGIQLYRTEPRQRWSIVIIAGVYVLVFLVTLFIYATRLYTTRTHLASIPKSRLPIHTGTLPKSVRRLVLAGIERSASVAFRARPRDLTGEDWENSETNVTRDRTQDKSVPVWGVVSHPGFSAPHDPENPSMPYEPILKELPNILEARAVVAAPPDPFAILPEDPPLEERQASPPDPRAVLLLQRTSSMTLRAYVAHLADLGVLDPVDLAVAFVQRYEVARFSGKPLSEEEFRALLESFALMLDTIQPPDPEVLAEFLDGSEQGSIRSRQTSTRSLLQDLHPSQISLSIKKQRSMASLNTQSTSNSVVQTRSRPQTKGTGKSASSVNESENYTTPGLTPGLPFETPFHTPYPKATSTKTASTGSLAGSEATIETARSQPARTIRSGKRTPSAYSRRSRRSRGSRSRSAFGLGLEVTEGEEQGYEQDVGDAAPHGIVVHEPTESDEGSVRRRSTPARYDSDAPSDASQDSVVVRRDGRRSNPGMIDLG